jgi:hypothetical protein
VQGPEKGGALLVVQLAGLLQAKQRRVEKAQLLLALVTVLFVQGGEVECVGQVFVVVRGSGAVVSNW